MPEMGPFEKEVRQRLAKAAFQGEGWDQVRAAGRTSNGGDRPRVEMTTKELMLEFMQVLDAHDAILIRLAAAMDAHEIPPPPA